MATYTAQRKRSSRKARKRINVHQNQWAKGYISTIDNSRRPTDSFSDLLNMEIVQDNIPRPRAPLVRYGTQPDLPVIGRGTFRYDGSRYVVWMLNDNGTGKIYKQIDGGAFTLIGGTYDITAWAGFVQAKSNLYVYNGVDNLTYVDLTDDGITTYTALTTPTISSVTKTGMAGTTYTHYYRVSANNEVGESIASAQSSVTSGKVRDDWIDGTDFTNVTWGAVSGATSYTVYYSNNGTDYYELYTVAGAVTFQDRGTLAINPFKQAPESNSTEGAVFKWMYVDSKNSQIYGITEDNELFYSAPGTVGSADFSPLGGGGFITIDEGGDTSVNHVDGFRDGKGNPVLTVSARGAAGKGKLFHVTFASITVGDQSLEYADVYQANGSSATYAPRATIKAGDALFYPTGQDFKSTGTSQNILNILTTNTISQVIEPDINDISIKSLDKAVGLEFKDRLYFALPVGSTENNQIWYMDLSRKNLWVLRWPIAAKDMWLYEDNQGGIHHCVLVNNVVLEFTRSGAKTHQDDGTAWRSRAAFASLKWDEDGITLGSVRRQYFKLLFPKGTVDANATGLTRTGATTSVGSDSFTVTTTPTGYNEWTYNQYEYNQDPGEVNTYGKSVSILELKPKGLLNQIDWEVTANTAGSDYYLSAVNTKGFSLDDLTLKTR